MRSAFSRSHPKARGRLVTWKRSNTDNEDFSIISYINKNTIFYKIEVQEKVVNFIILPRPLTFYNEESLITTKSVTSGHINTSHNIKQINISAEVHSCRSRNWKACLVSTSCCSALTVLQTHDWLRAPRPVCLLLRLSDRENWLVEAKRSEQRCSCHSEAEFTSAGLDPGETG